MNNYQVQIPAGSPVDRYQMYTPAETPASRFIAESPVMNWQFSASSPMTQDQYPSLFYRDNWVPPFAHEPIADGETNSPDAENCHPNSPDAENCHPNSPIAETYLPNLPEVDAYLPNLPISESGHLKLPGDNFWVVTVPAMVISERTSAKRQRGRPRKLEAKPKKKVKKQTQKPKGEISACRERKRKRSDGTVRYERKSAAAKARRRSGGRFVPNWFPDDCSLLYDRSYSKSKILNTLKKANLAKSPV